jgi:hypothetical protein
MSQTKAQLISDLVQALNFTGTASAPANGLFLSATNTLQLSTASTPRLTINSDGHVDVVGNLDVGAGLDVTGDITSTGRVTAADLTIQRPSGNLSALFVADSGLGTLEIGGSTGAFIDLKRPNSDDFDLRLETQGTGGIITSASGLTLATAVGSSVVVNRNLDCNADLTIDTNTLHVDSSNNRVGIGTTSPGHLLEVKSSAQNANDVITQIESVAVGSGLSKTSLELHKGSGYGAQLSGYIDQGVGSGFILSTLNGGTASEKLKVDSAGTLFSFSPDDTTPNIKWRSNDTNWFGSLNQSVEGSTISTFLAVAGDWSANGSTYSATKNFNGSFETRAIALHPQFNGGAGKVSFLVKAGGSSTTDGAVSEILKIDNDGIKFGGDTAAANALDDYEEGTWTPSFNNAGGLSTNNTVGKYTKIGRVVNWVCQIAVVRDSTSSSGTFTLGGLPFTSLNGATGGHGYAGCMGALFNWNVPDTAYQIGIRVPDNTTIIQFFANFDNTADAQLTSHFDANRTIFGSLSGQYIT